MKSITITQKDIEKAKINNTDSGYIIDELAYSAGQWTQNDLDENNWEYEPSEPYQYDFEADLFEHTKDRKTDLYTVAKTLGISLNANITNLAKKRKLQCGAFMALETPENWKILLEAYTENLKDNGTMGSLSKEYVKELEEAKDSYHDDQYKEWLYGDHRDYAGVIYEIAKYFTDERDGSYDEKAHSYSFALNDADIEKAKDFWDIYNKESGYSASQLKAWILSEITDAGHGRANKEARSREAQSRARAPSYLQSRASYRSRSRAKSEAIINENKINDYLRNQNNKRCADICGFLAVKHGRPELRHRSNVARSYRKIA